MKHFDKDRFEEILQVLSQNKLRTFLTACGVFWGVFMLISMLGFGNGIQKGVNDSMGGIATNAMWVWGEATTKPYNGFQPGRDINFYSEDVEAIRTTIEGVQYVCPEISLEDGAVVHRYAIMEEPAASTFMVMYRRCALSSRRHLYRDGTSIKWISTKSVKLP